MKRWAVWIWELLGNLPMSLIKTFKMRHYRSRQVPQALLSHSIQVSATSFLVTASMATVHWPALKGNRISGKTETFNNSTCQYRSERNGCICTNLLNKPLIKWVTPSKWPDPVFRSSPRKAKHGIISVPENPHRRHLSIKPFTEYGFLPSAFSLPFPKKSAPDGSFKGVINLIINFLQNLILINTKWSIVKGHVLSHTFPYRNII